MNDTQDLSISFQSLIGKRDFEAMEDLWIKALEAAAPPAELDPLLKGADAMLKAGQRERVASLIELSVPVFSGKIEAARLLEFHKRWCLAQPERDEPRKQFIGAFRETHGAGSVEAAYFEFADIARASDLRKALAQLERWMRFREGAFVFHRSGWGTGRIVSIDAILRRVSLNLERKPNHIMDLAAMGAVLDPLSDDHFLALRYQGVEVLKEMAESEPARLIGTVLDSFENPMDLKAIKERLIPEVLSNEEWSRWWGRAKKALREGGFFRVQDKSPYRIEKLENVLSYEDDLLAQFRQGDWNQRRVLARKALKDRGKEYPKLLDAVLGELEKMAESGGAGTANLEAAFFLDRYHRSAPEDSPLYRMLRASPDPVAAALSLDDEEEQLAAVLFLPRLTGAGWPRAAIEVLNRGLDPSRDAVCQLATAPELRRSVADRIENILGSPRPYPNFFVWAVRRSIDNKDDGLTPPMETLATKEFFECILDLFDHLNLRAERDNDQGMRSLLANLRGMVNYRSKRLFEKMLSTLNPSTGRALYERILDRESLTLGLRNELLDTMVKRMPEVSRPVNVPIWEQRTIFVTPQGLEKRREELRVLMEETLPENFREIGRAASFGDLRENAEYKAALEKRDFLTKRGEEMRAELDRVQLITPAMLKPDEVTLGSKVSLLNLDTQQRQAFRILGPWDGSPEEGVVSYKSPLGRCLLGTAAGREVEARMPGGVQRFQILAVEPGLDG